MPRSFLKTSALLIYPLMAIYALLLVPAYEIIAFDVTLASTLLFDAVDILMGWVEIAALALMLPFLITAVYRAGSAKACRALYLLLGGAFMLKYVGAIFALSIVHGALDATLNYGSYLLSLVLELLPLALTVLLVHRYTVNESLTLAARRKALEKMELIEKPVLPPPPPRFVFTYAEKPYEKVLEVKNLRLSAGEKELLKSLSFTLMRGEKCAIVGDNGTGKSTLIKELVRGKNPAVTFGRFVKVACYDQE
ncbi:MAG: ATP-binding cassette domain-containing protein, partial [Clostridia bacterium]|nr:ATP-binding cassette domain-containing protein [Clostridia bacterium]